MSVQGDVGPSRGDVVVVRQRQYLVEDVVPPARVGDDRLHRLVCLDDDAQGREVSLIWRHELGARTIRPTEQGLGRPEKFDEPRHFAAYLHALKWSSVTATEAGLFQAPFRAGIHLLNHQLVPLRKALALPRVNLFIADDVGLGKTIEAGLVLQELVLRQRADFVLVVCPAAVTLQWRDEMEKRFGLRFEVYGRDFVARRRQERGFGVNPWSTHHRFIVSHQTLRRSENFEPLLQHLGHRGRAKSLLIFDEAHNAAPASASKYAVETETTRTMSRLAEGFEHRLFLSATPHNGHSNSFSALLEILDPQRFTRGTRIRRAQLEPVMVRRLKEDLRQLGTEQRFPKRCVVRVDLDHRDGAWHASLEKSAVGKSPVPFELELATLLRRYTQLARPSKGRGKLVFVNLQKRLLSSVEAFHRTLRVHASAFGLDAGEERADASTELEDEIHGPSDDLLELQEADDVRSKSTLVQPSTEALECLQSMLSLAQKHRATPDAKLLAFLAWVRREQCSLGRSAKWSDRRVILFTEYGDTLRYLREQLFAAFEGTQHGELRVMTFHGGMSDASRAAVQAAFNAPPEDHAVRVLIATDAAREGINLQGHCADLFHFDVPWNPARLEQRNGRIDRTLQPAEEVRCHYFKYLGREEDAVLETLAEKVPVIERELGSLGAVLSDGVVQALTEAIDPGTAKRLETLLTQRPGKAGTVHEELEASRSLEALRKERDEVGKLREASQRVMDFRPELLRDALNVGFELVGAQRMEQHAFDEAGKRFDAWRIPALPSSWERTLDSVRPPREKEEAPWDWRKRPLNPVVFEAPERINSQLCQLHLSHPIVQRVMQRFLSQGFSASDLSRVSVVRSKRDSVARVLVFGRLSLFGRGAARLHDEVISVAAQWLESGGKGHLKPFAEEADRKAIDQLENTLAEAPELASVPAVTRKRLLASVPGDFAALWSSVEAEAKKREAQVLAKLKQRGAGEAQSLKQVLNDQRAFIEEELGRQLSFDLEVATEREQAEQWKRDRNHLQARLKAIDGELETQPAQLAEYFDVHLTRITPVGMIYLWPHSR